MSVDQQVLVVSAAARPGSLLKRLLASSGLVAAAAAFTFAQQGAGRFVLLILAIVVAAGSTVIYQRGKRIAFTFDGSHLFFTSRFSRQELFVHHKPGKVVELETFWWGGSGSPSSLWTLVNAEGVCEATVNTESFAPEALEDLRRRLGLEREVLTSPVKASEVLDAYPGLVPWWWAHMLGICIGGAIIAVVVIAAVSGH